MRGATFSYAHFIETDRTHFIMKVEILSLTHLIEIGRTRPL
jgi:hypothetical protein